MKIDLNHYGLIGFQKEWRALQRERKSNLLERFVDDCIASGVDGCAVTSEEYRIPRYSCHDRFGVLRKIAQREPTCLSFHRDHLSPEYVPAVISDNYMVIEKGGKRVCLLNAQIARIAEGEEKIAVLIVGDNTFPDGQSFSESLEYLGRKDIVIIPKKLTQHGSLPADCQKAMDVFLKYNQFYDAVVGFNAQFHARMNEMSRELSLKARTPYVAISNKHSFSGNGTSIDINDKSIDINDKFISKNEERFISSLKTAIHQGQFETIEKQERLFSSFMWKALFVYGTRNQRHLNYRA